MKNGNTSILSDNSVGAAAFTKLSIRWASGLFNVITRIRSLGCSVANQIARRTTTQVFPDPETPISLAGPVRFAVAIFSCSGCINSIQLL